MRTPWLNLVSCALVCVLLMPQDPLQASARRGVVVSAHLLASEAGAEMLGQGGNAIDAAVATGFALAVVYPEAGNIGGGGFLLLRLGDGTSHVIDCRETAPARAHRTMFLDSLGQATGESFAGARSAGVPGMVAGLLLAHERYGRLPRARVLAPAIRLAERGFSVDARLEIGLAEYREELLRYPSTRKVFAPRDSLPREGDLFKQPDLAVTLRRIARLGWAGFYTGPVARKIVRQLEPLGGIISLSDLAEFKAVERAPVRGTYRGYEILSIPPPSSGGVCLLQMLNMAEHFDLAGAGFHSVRSIHVMAECMRRAFADRSAYLGDPGFSQVPVERLISKEYAATRVQGIDSIRASRSSDVSPGDVSDRQGGNTTHYVAADSSGNVVSITTTLNDMFGNKIIVDGAGFFLNNTMDDFSVKPGAANFYGLTGSEANAIVAGKRPLSSMTPAIVLLDGSPVLAMGSRGGPRIITSVFQTIVNVVDYGMDLRQAVTAPRFHHQWQPDTLLYEQFAWSPEVLVGLHGAGHAALALDEYMGRLHAVFIDRKSGIILGIPDYREGGAATGK